METLLARRERQTIWDMCEAGVPVKRIARHLGRQNVVVAQVHRRRRREASLGSASAGAAPLARRARGDLERPGCGRFHPCHRRGAGSLAFDCVSGGQHQRRAKEVPGPGGRPGGVPTAGDPSGPSSLSAGGSEGSSNASSGPDGRPGGSRRGWLGIPRSPGDAGVPRAHLPITVRPEPWSAAQRAPLVPAELVVLCDGPRPTPRATLARATFATW